MKIKPLDRHDNLVEDTLLFRVFLLDELLLLTIIAMEVFKGRIEKPLIGFSSLANIGKSGLILV